MPNNGNDLIDNLFSGADDDDDALDSSGVQVVLGYKVPAGARRINVVDEQGRKAWRRLDQVQSTDSPVLTDKGEPLFMMGDVGRPKKKNELHDLMPSTNPVTAELIKIKAAQVQSDPILKIAGDQPESPEVLNQVILALVEESASLRFERMEAERNGRDASAFSMRRVNALKAVGDTWIKRREQISSQLIDLESGAFQELFKFIVETFTRAMQSSGVRGEQCDTIVNAFAKMLDESWRSEANRRMKG